MKKLIFTIATSAATLFAIQAVAQQDTTKSNTKIEYGSPITIGKKGSKGNAELHNGIGISIGGKDTTGKVDPKKGRFIGGITFTRFDLGFTRLIDNGSFSLSPTNDFLDYRGGKTSTVSFDVLQFGYRFAPSFKVYLAAGFDWTHIRLEKDVTIQKNTPDLVALPETIHFSKNRFSSSYVHIPLNFELRTKENTKGKRFYFVLGPEVGFLLNGKVKQISDERGKVKEKDNYNFTPFRYGGTFRFGYGDLGLFAKYYASDMFETTAQKGLKSMAFGISLGIH